MTQAVSQLRRLARAAPAPAGPAPQAEAQERCELCGNPVEPEHRHLIDLKEQRLLCACRPCSILFDSEAAGGGHYRLVPDRVRSVQGFRLDDALWASFNIPVELAFFFESSAAGRVVAFYPGPMGATESLLDLSAWADVAGRNPVLQGLRPDVEALLVNRTRGEREYWLVGVDRCYALVGLIRSQWKGLAGGEEVWRAIDAFLDDLRGQARTVTYDDGKEAR